MEIDPKSLYSFEELALPRNGVKERGWVRPYILFNMVASVDGKTTTNGAGLAGLGAKIDRIIMRKLRSQVDGVLVGGNTLRIDPFVPTVTGDLLLERSQHFNQAQPWGIVLSQSGDLPLDHPFWRGGPRLVITRQGLAKDQLQLLSQGAEVRQVSSDPQTGQLELKQVLTLLHQEFGIDRLLSEAGARLNRQLLPYGDELFLTISPHLIGGDTNATLLSGEQLAPLQVLKLKSCYRLEDHLFLRYRLKA
ncbi:MAG: RibD family protein [Pseudanabaenaceae cyanobacterium bins.68]|nr:RibD family protein [Pseudanabaenaceae cyanobacterium bins.68]